MTTALLIVAWAVFVVLLWFSRSNRGTSSKAKSWAWWQAVADFIGCYQQHWALHAWLGLDNREGWFVLFRTVFLLLLLATVAACPASLFLDWPAPFIVAIVAAIILVDAIMVNTSIVFVTRRPMSTLRSAVLTVAMYFNLAQGFAVGWLQLRVEDDWGVERVVDAMYQSLRSLATVGPDTDGPISTAAKLLVLSELGVGIYIVVIVLAIYASWAQRARPS